MKKIYIQYFVVLFSVLLSFGANAQLTGTKNIPGDYATLAAAITDLNTVGVGAGGVTLNVLAGNPQSSPSALSTVGGGYVIGGAGSLVLTTASAANPILIVGNGNTITAPTGTSPAGHVVGQLNDAIIKLVGADWVTISGFTLQENAGNTVTTAASNNMTEFGIALFYASATDGCQNNTIQNNTITLNRTYQNAFGIYSNVRTTTTSMSTSAEVATTVAGSNSFNKVYGNAISNVNYGIIFIGAVTTVAAIDNGNDIGGNAAGTGNTITNWGGIGVTPSTYISLTGANSGIVMHQQINDNVSYNTITSFATGASGTMAAITLNGIAKTYGATPTGTITSNITNNNITVTSAPTTGFVQAISSTGLTALSTSTLNINNNNIINCAITGAAATTGGLIGITNSSVFGTLNMNNNIISGGMRTGTTGQCQGISNSGAIVNTLNINSNQFGSASAEYVTTSTATSGVIFGVSTSAGAATCVTTIQNNDIRRIVHSVAATAPHQYITSTGAVLTCNISNNTFTNLSINTTGTVIFIAHSYSIPATGSLNINENSIVTGFRRTLPGFITISTTNSTSGTGSINNYTNNNFSNITVPDNLSSTILGFNNTDGGTGSTKQVTGNTFSNWHGGTVGTTGTSSTITAMNFTYWNGVSSLSNNTITNITGRSTLTGVNIGSTSSAATSITVANNIINNLTSIGTGGTVIGISCSNASTLINISGHSIFGLSSTGASTVSGISISGAGAGTNVFKNKIYNLSGSNASSTVNGILVSAGTTISVFNNLIGTLTTPAANAANPLNGLNITGGTTVNAYFNTINLAASSSGALFGSSAISASTTPALTLRNNIFVNTSTVTGAGLAVAYRRSSATLTTYAAASNKNLFSASTIYTDGTTPQATLAAYQALVTPRDANSISETPNFLSTNGSDATFLHINTSIATAIDAGADLISGITDDYDGDTRNVTTPDIGADEFTLVIITCTGQPAAGAITPSTVNKCVNQTHSMTATGLTTGTGILYQWQVATVSGGPYSNVIGGTGATSASYTTAALTAGIYYYVLQTSCSFSSQTNITNEVIVTVNALPTVAVLPISAAICQPGATAVPLTASGASTYTWSPTTGLTPSTGANVSALPNGTTTYTVTGTDGNGCINTATSTITVNPAPVITSTTATPTSVCSGSNSQLQVNVASSVVKITEVTLFRTGTGATVTYPAYIAGADLVELSNLSAVSVDISGFTLSDYATNSSTISHPFTFPVGTIIPSNGVAVVNLGTGTDDIANRYYNTGGTSDSWSSGSLVGIVLKAGTQVLDAVGLNTGYVFNAGTGVSAADWSGIASSPSGFAGTIRSAVTDGNTGSDWTASSVGTPQTIGTYNGGYTPVSSSFTYSWSPITFLSDPTIANPVATAVTSNTTYTVTVSTGTCSSTGTVTVSLATYNSAVTTQPSIAAVTAGTLNNQILTLDIPQACAVENLTQLDFTNASSLPADVASAKVYYTTTNTFATTTLFGTVINPAATFSVTGTQALSTTTRNYFWLVYDVACNATNANTIDAGIISFTVGASSYIPTPLNPTGTRTITGLATLFTTTQPSTAVVTSGSVNQQMVGVSVPPTDCGALTAITFNTNGSTSVSDIATARVFYTTSTTFSTTTQFGTDVTAPNGTFNVTGSQTLSNTLTNYFWLVYDVSCGAVAANVLDAEINSVTIAGNAYAPAAVNPTGTRTITALYAPTRTDGNSTTAIPLGTQNAQMVYAVISGSAICPGTVTTVNWTATNTNASDVVNAKCFYTTTTTFSTANPYGTAVANPATGALSFTGSQLLATGTNYFWVVYDINCSGTVGASVNADINSLVVSASTIPVTGTATSANLLVAVTSFTTVADGEWSNTATWACGIVPPTNATPVTIAHNVTVSNAGNIGGSVTINSGRSLTINTSGVLTLGTVGGGNRVLTNNGTLAVTGGTLNQNGSIVSSSSSIFNQSGGNINIDGNAGGVTANSVASGVAILQFNQLNAGINLTGGTLTIVDPHAAASGNSVGVNNATAGSQTSTVNHTIRFGDGISTDAGGNTNGFNIDNWTGTTYLSFGNIIINGGSGVNRLVTSTYQLSAVGDVTITANSTLTSGSSLVVGRNLTIDALGTFRGTTSGGLAMALVTSNTSSTLTFSPSNVPQSITNNGTMNNLAASPTANLVLFLVANSHPSGVTLNSPLRVSSGFTMTSGLINTSSTNLLTLGFNATNTGTLTYTDGRINGPFKRWIGTVTGLNQFPMGDATNFKNASLNFTVAPTTAGTLTANWSTTAPTFPNVSPLNEVGPLLINKVSAQGSWFIDAGDGLAGGTYSGTFTANGSTDVLAANRTVLLKRPSAGGDWVLDGTHVTSTGTITAPVLSRNLMTGFSEFAIGGELNVALPVTIEYLKGTKQGNGNFLDWKITCTSTPSVVIELQRSGDGRKFDVIKVENATALRCQQSFDHTDATPLAGINYYRLKITEPTGEFKYSNIIAILNKDKGFELISIAPNPVKSNAILTITSAKAGKVEIMISDIAGKVVVKQSNAVIAGNNPINMNFATLGAGTYSITATNADGDTKTTRFVKY